MASPFIVVSNPLLEVCQEKGVDVRQLVWPDLPAILAKIERIFTLTTFVEIEEATCTLALIIYYKLPSVLSMMEMLYLSEKSIIFHKVSQPLFDVFERTKIDNGWGGFRVLPCLDGRRSRLRSRVQLIGVRAML